ncbi:MAG TPA: hypothetical protein VNF49_09090 [Candidatus Binataceae bacterium]|nr:hypothetical protein [Candidatus Binataceae bacterium]
MANPNSGNRGEGNPEAAARFNTTETAFVESARGKEEIRKGVKVPPAEERALADAEQRGKARSKDSPSAPEGAAKR